MIKKKRIKNMIKKINLLSIGEPFKLNTDVLLNCSILEIGVQPKIIPRMTLYKTAKQTSEGVLDISNVCLINAYYNDLNLIKAMLQGVLNNYNRYKPKNPLYSLVEKVLTCAMETAVNTIYPNTNY